MQASSVPFLCIRVHLLLTFILSLLVLGNRAGSEVRPETLVCDRQALKRSDWKAVQRTLAQPPEPRGEKDLMDRRRRSDHLPGS